MTTRPLLCLLLASSALAQTGPSVCASILMGEDKVACMKAIAGHWVDPGAAGVCAGVLMADDKTACLRASLDKRYSQEELAACRGILMGDDKAACMAAAGSSERRGRDDEGDAPPRSRRASRRSDENDGEGSARRPREPAPRWATLTNFSGETIVRTYWRRPAELDFHQVQLRAPLHRDHSVDLPLPDEAVQVCVESASGYRLVWPLIRRDQGLNIPEGRTSWVDADCRDLQ